MAGAISKVALWNLGFRPFFLGAAVFAIVSMTFWMGVYVLQLPLSITRISTFQWHAHEMIYGFAMAVIDHVAVSTTGETSGFAVLNTAVTATDFWPFAPNTAHYARPSSEDAEENHAGKAFGPGCAASRLPVEFALRSFVANPSERILGQFEDSSQ